MACFEPRKPRKVSSSRTPSVIGEPAHFRFFTSTHRRSDRIGDAINIPDDSLYELEAIETVLPPTLFDIEGAIVPIKLKSRITTSGMLELWCEEIGGAGRWKLEVGGER